MADLKFPCPRCGTTIECDELWSGHQLQCPACQGELTVPAKAEPAPAAASPESTLQNLAKAGSSAPKLSIGGPAVHQRAGVAAAHAPQAAAFQSRMNQAKAKKNTAWVKYVVWAVVAVAAAIGGYYGYNYYTEMQAKKAEAAKQAAAPPAETNNPAEPAAPKEAPMTPPVWTLNPGDAKIPKGKANGMWGGTNFVVESAQFDKGSGTYLLRLDQGASGSPDLQVKIYLQLGPTEKVAGHSWNITPDMKGKGVPQVLKLWKPNPKYAAQQKLFNTGYAMKLELGKIADGAISGKIFLALPDKEQSVVGGSFKANTTVTDAPSAAAGAEPVPTAASPAQRDAFEKRYGKKK
jgi:hypothetical protein